ncbi:peptide-methionine (R)-S-oxide reductase MsrB [Sediminispirochaeta smaragdinae]|uniref:Peptide methionine sulfoxide reductase MsrA n=2 Tax=Sediminispirochaeta TaxID=1911556 RepID=E1R8Q1_SEDSS|nr:peptide-methionine (R)-S-oxide reductase MsrB [Sediminispirochaeta smaragdinae]ADK81808.1 methionine-R-sulfoxide reductase [Sediminispirochaeta smaragdinae DSM 11293]
MKGASFLLIALLLPWNLHASGEVEQRLPEMLFSETHLQALEAYDSAVFAGGCFWCLEKPFEELVGVAEAVSGYSGGDEKDPRYQDVASGRTGHRESVTVYYNSEVITYRQLLDVFWRNIDPTDGGGQFADRGSQYAPAIFVGTRGEREAAEASKKQLEASGTFSRPILVEILDRRPFYPAEEYHQDYYKKNREAYDRYYTGSGRGPFVDSLWNKAETSGGLATKEGRWGNFDKQERLSSLTDFEYRLTQEGETEPAFANEFWDNKEEGIYVDIVSGEPLFSSTDAFSSGTGWPSFIRPIDPDHIRYLQDTSGTMQRIEVRSRYADSHLGHVFTDGPDPTGLRFCINSAALRFIPRTEMKEAGYEEYLLLFDGYR